MVIFGFIIFSFTIGKWCIEVVFNFVQDEVKSQDKFLTLIVGLAFLWGSLSKSLSFEPLLGVFIVGIIIGEIPRFHYEVKAKLQSIAMAIFSPVFFAIAGLKVNIYNLMTVDYLIITLIVIAVACFGKVVGAYLGARFIGHTDHWTALGFGAALNARGAMEIIVATIGLAAGILSQEMFSIIVIMALTTSLMAPAFLQMILKHMEPVDEELKRLEEEKLLDESPIAKIHKVLFPMREPKDEQLTEWQILRFKILEKITKKRELSLTILHVNPIISEKPDHKKTLNLIKESNEGLDPGFKVAKAKSAEIPAAILDEAEKGYDLMVLGSTNQGQSIDFFSSIVSEVVRMSPCPTILTYANHLSPDWEPRNILVAVSNSTATKYAAELGLLIAGKLGTVTLLSVLTGTNSAWSQNVNQYAFDRQTDVAVQAINTIKQLALIYNVSINDIIEVGDDVESTILKVAEIEKSDLIILGTNVKSGSERLFLGSRIEYMIQHAKCPIVVLNV